MKPSQEQAKVEDQDEPVQCEENPTEDHPNEIQINESVDKFEIEQPKNEGSPAEDEAINLKKPEDTISREIKPTNDLDTTLKKLAETLHLKIEEKEKQFRSRPTSVCSKSVKDSISVVPSQESVKTVTGNENRQIVSVDLETIHSLKEDIKKISENFKVLHEIILEKADSGEKNTVKKETEESCKESEVKENSPLEESESIPSWLKSSLPRPHPYNVYTAFRQKMNLQITPSVTSVQSESSVKQKTPSISSIHSSSDHKYGSDFEALSIPSDRLRSVSEIIEKVSVKSVKFTSGTTEEDYFTFKNDSGSELSSSVWGSDNHSPTSPSKRSLFLRSPKVSNRENIDKASTSSIPTEITSKCFQVGSSKNSPSISVVQSRLLDNRENLVLVTPDLKLISNDLSDKKLNNKTLNVYKSISVSPKNQIVIEELNNSEGKSIKDQKTESTISEMIDNLSENEKSLKIINEKPQNAVQRMDEARRSFFQPEMLHLQFQAELTLLETFQQSLTHFLEAERLKTLSEVNKIVSEKSVNTEKFVQKEDQAVQTSFIKDESSEKTTTETEESESVKTEINVSEMEERSDREKVESVIQTEEEGEEEKKESEILEQIDSSSKPEGNVKETEVKEKEEKVSEKEEMELSGRLSGISFQMLNRMMKDEELRSEHQLALIRLREKALNEKVKAELTFLEMKKRALKERGGDEEQNISAIKKKQRGIIMKYQSEKEEIERLKKMHKIASEERKIMIKQQKQIQQMQLSTNDMIIKLKRRERSPLRKSPLKPRCKYSNT